MNHYFMIFGYNKYTGEQIDEVSKRFETKSEAKKYLKDQILKYMDPSDPIDQITTYKIEEQTTITVF